MTWPKTGTSSADGATARDTVRQQPGSLTPPCLDQGEFFDNAISPYAILSHAWGREEVTLRDCMTADRTKLARGEGSRH